MHCFPQMCKGGRGMSKHKRTVVKAAAALALFLLVCTAAARSVYTLMLPQVSTAGAQIAALRSVDVYAGQFAGESAGADVLAEGSWTVTEQLAAVGDRVEAGTPLLRIDITDFQIQLQQLQASIQQQRNTINGTNWTGGDRLVLNQQLAALEMQYRQLADSFPADGIVYAPAAGTVSTLAGPGLAARGSVLAHITAQTAAGQVAFTVPAAALERVFSSGAALECAFTAVSTQQPIRARQYETALLPARAEVSQTGGYTVYADLEQQPEEPVAPGTAATVTVESKSEDYTCVPLSAIFYGTDGPCVYQVLQRDTIWGTEHYVQAVSVEVIDSDAVNAAVENLPGADAAAINVSTRYACYPSRALVDGETVRVAS